MGRLIDASVFAESLILCDGLGRKSLESVLSVLKEQPTAYDVEKVVAELKENYYKNGGMFIFDEVIEIVRKGGAT